MAIFQGVNVAEVNPVRTATTKPVMQYKRITVPNGLVVNADAAIGHKRHGEAPQAAQLDEIDFEPDSVSSRDPGLSAVNSASGQTGTSTYPSARSALPLSTDIVSVVGRGR